MAEITVKELLSGASATTKSLPYGLTQWTRKRTFRVFTDDGTPITQPDAMTEVGVIRGDEHPDDEACWALTSSVSPISNTGGWVDVEWTYKGAGAIVGGGDDPDEPDYSLATGVPSISISQILQPAWRENADVPSTGNLGGSFIGTADIGGSAIDNRGHGQTRTILVQSLSVTIQSFGIPSMALIRSMTGRRNNTTYFGASSGTFLYKGVSGLTRDNQGVWTTTHQFAWDDQYHLRQFPARDFDNRIKIGVEGGDYENRAYEVFWFQPFPDYGDFAALGISI